jgi:hypothetical protein
MKVLNLSGGVKCTVIGDSMQRAPVFVFDSAAEARDFVKWVQENLAQDRRGSRSHLQRRQAPVHRPYLASKFAYLRFNYSTGDAAGQNMVGRATFAACSWILDTYPNIRHFYLESNLATDKKASQVNIMHTRGKRVVAEAVLKRNVLIEHMRVEPESLFYHSNVSNVGAILSGANNNGAHSANGITAMFIATGQDVANVAESSAGIFYTEMTPERDLYISITIPSLIVATYGGGTGWRRSASVWNCSAAGGAARSTAWRRSLPAWCWPARFRWRRRSRRRTGSPATRSMAATARHTPPGRYRHFKGREYEVLGVALHSERAEELVVYRPLYGSYRLMVRPAAMFQEVMERDGVRTLRFVYLGSTTMNKLTPSQWHAARDYLLQQARPLEAARYRYHFEDGQPRGVLAALASLSERRRRLWPRAGARPAHAGIVGAGDECGLPDA